MVVLLLVDDDVVNSNTLEPRAGFMGVGGGPCFGTTGVGAKNFCDGGKSAVVTSVGLISSSSSLTYPNFDVSIVGGGGTTDTAVLCCNCRTD